MFILFLLMCFNVYGSSEPAESSNPVRSIAVVSGSLSPNRFASPEEESELCDLAVRRLSDSGINLNGRVTPYLRDIINREAIQSGAVDISSVQVLRRLKSGELDDHEDRYIQRLVMGAIKESMDHKDQQIEERWSTTQSICGMVTAGVITTAISTIVTVLIERSK